MSFPFPYPLLTVGNGGPRGSVQFVGSGTFTGSGTSTYNFSSLSNPSGGTPTLQQNDLVILVVANGNSSDRPQSELMPSDYTAMHTDIIVSNQLNFQASYKFMGPTPDTSLSITVGDSLPTHAATVHVFRNVDVFTPIDATVATATGTGTENADAPSYTPVTPGAWVIAAGGASRSASNIAALFTLPSGFNNATNYFRVDLESATIDSMAGFAIKTDWTSGAVDPAALGSGTADAWAAITFALRPGTGTAPTIGSAPTIRASALQYVNNASSATFTFPTGSQAGDMCVIAAGHGFLVNVPSGWSQVHRQVQTNQNGATFVKTLTSSDISTGSVSISFGGAYYGTIIGVTFNGATGGIRTYAAVADAAGASSRTETTDSSPKTSDLALRFGFGRFNGTVSLSDGTQLQTNSALNASAVLNSKSIGSNGSDSATFNFSATPLGDYVANVIVAPVNAL